MTDPQRAMLLHQVRAVRLNARAYLYQIGGAWGFRDQLQDCANLIDVDPKPLRLQIYRCAAAQFPEGDVLHWFHAIPRPSPHARGVRSRCADDLLWLPWAAAKLFAAGEKDFLTKRVRFLAGEPLGPGEDERYADFFPGTESDTVYGHCLRALWLAAGRRGGRGLPVFGTGDWNDALGALGAGESVWAGEFLALVCDRFLPVAAAVGTAEDAAFLTALSADMKRAVLAHGYNGSYFLRGFYPDGAPLGATPDGACIIDLLPQAFAVFANIGTPEQRRKALKTAFDRLYSPETRTLRLFSEPFGEGSRSAGYVNDYPEGVRENGGQYTHAALWFCRALEAEGLADLAALADECADPVKRLSFDPAFPNEPYFVTADVGHAPASPGLAGWSGYTGAAGWLFSAKSV